MTTPATLPALDPFRQTHDREARLLVELLRTAPLALLFAEAGSDKTALLQLELLPLLCRRRSDRPARAAARESSVVPFPDRRGRSSPGTAKRRREFVIYFDDWTDTPLAALRTAIYRAAATSPAERAGPLVPLSEILATLSVQFDANFIILLDRFEEFLEAPAYQVDIAQFANELVGAVNQSQLTANFLLSLNEAARPRLASLRSRIPGFDDFSLKLTCPQGASAAAPAMRPPEPPAAKVVEAPPVLTEALTLPAPVSTPACSAAAAPTAASTTAGAAARKVKRPPLPRVPIKTEDVYSLIEARLSGIARGGTSASFVAGESVTGERMGDCHVPEQAQARHAEPVSALPEKAGADLPPLEAAVSQPSGPAESPPPTRRTNLQEAVEWMGRRLRAKPKSKSKQGT